MHLGAACGLPSKVVKGYMLQGRHCVKNKKLLAHVLNGLSHVVS